MEHKFQENVGVQGLRVSGFSGLWFWGFRV